MPLNFKSINLPAPPRRTRTATGGGLVEADYQNITLYILILIGIGLRLFQFIYNRSFFIDELFLNVNIVKLDFWGLATRTFEYQQKAPLGYLWAVKLLTTVLGNSEQVLRLFSLLCGISSLFLFVPVARHFLRSWGVVIAVGVLSISYTFIYHSVEAKQYCTELTAAILALFLYTKYHDRTDLKSLLIWGVAGAILLWFSFSLIFIAAGIAGAVCLDALLRKEWRRFFMLLIPFTLWLVSFGVLYFLFVRKFHESAWLIDFFKRVDDAFMPLPPASVSDLTWLVRKPYSLLDRPLGLMLYFEPNADHSFLYYFLRMGWLYAPTIVLGAVLMLRKNRLNFSVLVLPVLLTMAASGLKVYPFHQRFLLFLGPVFLLMLAYGFERFCALFPRRYSLVALGLLLVLTPALVNSAEQVNDPHQVIKDYNREVVLFVNQNYKPGDAVYVYWNMRQAYEFYKAANYLKFNAIEASYVKNKSRNPADYINHLKPDFKGFKGKKRLWFIYDTNNRDPIGDFIDQPAWYHDQKFVPGKSLEQEFSKMGKQKAHYQLNTFNATLFELK
ncbi:ArnT family glycosyltransferase [Hymenobacter jejuensis]|uniref:Glycosyltransferase family 39 protein n=1 Tax=Hymenobacter jejuensis TaxID=2502781 RepID=A0A5B8A642_9BACT|nr:glycosyltransferase family 39 protein [Hymenobacter jejuensis]QDA62203.1 glycosyltransferase family 39 protein [Hymenobacter jejuensis]